MHDLGKIQSRHHYGSCQQRIVSVSISSPYLIINTCWLFLSLWRNTV